jgi:hypothetical protein
MEQPRYFGRRHGWMVAAVRSSRPLSRVVAVVPILSRMQSKTAPGSTTSPAASQFRYTRAVPRAVAPARKRRVAARHPEQDGVALVRQRTMLHQLGAPCHVLRPGHHPRCQRALENQGAGEMSFLRLACPARTRLDVRKASEARLGEQRPLCALVTVRRTCRSSLHWLRAQSLHSVPCAEQGQLAHPRPHQTGAARQLVDNDTQAGG